MNNTDENEVQKLIEGLDWRYNSCINATSPKSFFLNLFDYGRFVWESPAFEDLVQLELKIIQANDQNLLDDLWSQVTEETNEAFSKLEKFIADKDIKNAEVWEDIESFKRFDKGKAESTAGPVEGKMDEVRSILRHLNEIPNKSNEIEMFLRKFIILNDTGGIDSYTFSPSYSDYLLESERHFRTRESTVWFSWWNINLACRIYFDFEGLKKGLEAKGKALSSMGLEQKYEELTDIIEHEKIPVYLFDESKSVTTPEPKFFKVEDFRRYLGMFHQFAKEELEKRIPEKKISLPDIATLELNGKYWIKRASPENGKVTPGTKDYRFLRAIIEKQSRDPASGLTIDEAWDAVESSRSKGKSESRRRTLDGDFSNLKKKVRLVGKNALISTGGLYRFASRT